MTFWTWTKCCKLLRHIAFFGLLGLQSSVVVVVVGVAIVVVVVVGVVVVVIAKEIKNKDNKSYASKVSVSMCLHSE